MKTHFLRLLTAVATLALLHVTAPIAHAQWQAQTVTLKPGWNAVFLHVDATHVALDSLIVGAANPIAEVWLWQAPVSTLQFTESPAQPSAANSQWAVWDRSPVVTDSLTRLIGNAAYLVRNTNTRPAALSVDHHWPERRRLPHAHERPARLRHLFGAGARVPAHGGALPLPRR